MSLPTQVQKLIELSGNTFHAKVARWFAENEWSVAISPYYFDQTQQKARELDLIVEKAIEVRDSGNLFRGRVLTRLFVECKYLPGYSVFWMTNKNTAAIEKMLTREGGFRDGNSHTLKHHYFFGEKVAKLFSSSNSNGQESELFYKALNQSLNALVSRRDQTPKLFLSAKQPGGFKVVLNFPVIVCNTFSQLYAADFVGQREVEQIRDNFQLEVEYAYIESSGLHRDELFLIDIVEYEQLSKLASNFLNDAHIAGYFAMPD